MSEERDETPVVMVAPQWAWDTIFETLSIDAQSNSFDPELRKEVTEASDAVEERNY